MPVVGQVDRESAETLMQWAEVQTRTQGSKGATPDPEAR